MVAYLIGLNTKLDVKQVLHSMGISQKKMETFGRGQSCLWLKGSQFHAFNKQIFTNQFSCQKVIEMSQIFSKL